MRPPHLPYGPRTTVDEKPLAWIRDYMNGLAPHVETANAIHRLFDNWHRNSQATLPIQTIRRLLDSIRELPRGDERIMAINTVVRTLGTPAALATLLDMMQDSARRTGSTEQELSLYSRREAKHSSYGWCGQTKLICSSSAPTRGTLLPEIGVQEILGNAPATRWGLNMHIWQPNPSAKGFPSGKQTENAIVEPPHSHPYDFASMIVIGSMHQSIYAECKTDPVTPSASCAQKIDGRYSGVTLEHVHGVWPPHAEQESTQVTAVEKRILLSAGDSYYLPCNVIHDVEVDALTASVKPTITLFLRSECVVKPHAYVARSMIDFHADHPDIEHLGKPMVDLDWHEKLRLVSDYLRGVRPNLILDDVVKSQSEYAFFHN